MTKKRIILWLALLTLPYLSFSTHIVGGVLNYSYNGGNVYTITLKLYRDCGSSAAAFPGNVTIKIKGNNGANLSPSKDLTINLGNISTLSANLLPCAVAPNPIPCVQEGVYSKTITLPPNVGGYHLYYQVSARNLSLTNINGVCNCIGESFYAYIPNNTVSSNSNSNAVFSLFPPLFICANQPFTFNHSATDADGDSLAYSLYTPYNDNVAPSYSNNIAIFPEVVYQPGYTTNNPLGANPFFLNPVTGVLTGTPNTIGQFVVGVRVKEYRNGVYISQTLRDFQFNVLNCPAPPPTLAISNMTINNGCSVKVTATGITSASSTWRSIYPGTLGAYNNFLSCTANCLNPTVTAVGTPPAYVDFVVCGIATNCLGNNVCDTFRVHFNPPLSVSITPGNPALCNGQTSTTLTAIGSGGTPPYIYLWNNVNPTQTISVGAGTYNIKLTDGSGCPPAFGSAIVSSYSVPVAVNAGSDKTICITNPVAALNGTISGATGGIWSGGTGTFSPGNTSTSGLFYTPTASELTAGSTTLILTTTGSGACPSASDAVVIYYSGFTGTVSTSSIATSCYNGNNGSASVSISGGMGPHTYIWNTVPTQSTANAINLAAGNYSVSILNAIGCQSQTTVSVSQPSPVALNSTLTNVSCFAGSNGSISVAALGGTSPYTYSWSPGSQSGASVTGLTAGTFSVKVTDAKSCVLTSTFSVTQPSSLTISFSPTNVSCFNGANGVIQSTVTGGTAAYTYSWNPGGASSPNISGLQAGTYSLTVKDNLNCILSKTISLTQPAILSVISTVTNETCNYLDNGIASATASGGTSGYTYTWQPGSYTGTTYNNLSSGNYSLTARDLKGCTISTIVVIAEPAPLSVVPVNQINVSCFGGSNGSASANASGGTAAYTFSWLPLSVNSPSITNLASGTYSVFVTDSKSCSATGTVTITEPPALTIGVVNTSVSCYGGNNGTSALNAGGGTIPYSYFWLPSGQSSSSLSGLSAGSYTAQVTDAKGCKITATTSVAQASTISIVFTQTNVSCFNGSDGILNSIVSGGNGAYSYNWSPGNINMQGISGIAAGIYTLHITDLFNCSAQRTASISQPSPLTLATSVTNEACNYLNNGTASVSASGGIPGYSFLWLPGTFSTTGISNLSSGNYTVIATDAKGCTANTVVIVNEPALLTASILSVIPVSCFGGNNGSATAAGSGGTANYSYTWTPGGITTAVINNLGQGIYTVTVSDSKSCISQTTVSITQPSSITLTQTISPVSCYGGNNGSVTTSAIGGTSPYTYLWLPSGQTTSFHGNLSSGTVSVNVHDANGCQVNANYSITQSSSISIALSGTQVSCFNGINGKINSTIVGGNAPYSFSWSYGGITTQSINALPAGTYSLLVTDNLNCNAVKTISLSQPASLAITTTLTNETCNYLNNGKASAFASGGTPGYTYLWQPGALASASLSNLASGTYTVFITDLLGCTKNTSVTITEPVALAVTFSNTVDVSCNGGNDGSATANGSGGTPNYSYTWTPGNVTGSMINNLAIGIYSVSVSDFNGCLAQNTVVISEPLPLNLISSISNVVCNGGSNGAISISMSGGTAPYAHNLMPGNIAGANFTNLLPGTYSIITTDGNNCMNSTTITINQPINISTSTSFTNADCATQNGVASISVTSGGTPPFLYNWLPSGGTSSLSTSLYAGSYSVEVTDALGCVSTKIVNINNNNAPVVSIVSTTNVNCFGGSDGAVTATHSGSTSLCTYSWSPFGGTALTASNLSSGIYVIQVTDNAGCIGLATSSMIAEPPPVVVSVFPTNVSCFGGVNGGVSANISGGTPGYSYSWTPVGITTTSLSGLTANTYTLEITDAHSCVQSKTFAITQPAAPLSISVSSSSVSCFAGSDGSLTLTSSGATAPYNYNVTPGNFSSQFISNLTAGTYTIYTNDVKGCNTTTTVTITEPTPILLTTGAINSNCSLANGQVSVTASGGIGSYTYSWVPSGGTNFNEGNLFAGNYGVTVTDANNCTAVASQSLVDNPEPLVSISSVTNVSCFSGSNGAATATVSGGTGPFTYSWIPAGGTSMTGNGLSTGNYSVTVTSANGCTVMTASPFITEPAQIFILTNPSDVSCFGGTNGSASVTVFGGTPAYSYSWQAGSSTTNVVSGLPAGNYTILATDANLCVQTNSFVVAQPNAALSASLSSLPVSCFGGTNGIASASISGGTAPYNFNWMPGNLNGQTIANLIAGIYSLTATDMNGCSVTSTVVVNEPTAVQASITAINSNCSFANGQLSANASGGTALFIYNWAPTGGSSITATNLLAGTYTLTVTDSNNCIATTTETLSDNPAPLVSVVSLSNVSCFNGTNGSASATVFGGTGPFTYSWIPAGGSSILATGLSAGSYSVSVISANGCSVISSSSIISEPSQISTSIFTSSVNCFGDNTGSATFMTGGGIPGYTYTWPSGSPANAILSGLTAGNYVIDIRDANNCIQTASFTITEPSAPLGIAVTSSSQVSCYNGTNGSATVTGTGGTSAYTFNWIPYGGNTSNATGLSAGTFTTSITDNNGCTTFTTLTITQPSQPLSATVNTTGVSCFGGSNGSATVTALGGTAGYSYLWSPGGSTLQSSGGLSSGNYTVSILDANYCRENLPVVINEPSSLSGSLIPANASCGMANGSVSSQISGGTGPYTYFWQPGSYTTTAIYSLTPGTYTMELTDAANCAAILSTTLINVPGPQLTIPFTKNVSCFGGNNGSATLSISQGTSPFSINWQPFGGSTTTGSSLLAGTFTANVTDALGCTASKTVAISEPAVLDISVTSIKKVSCYGDDDGAIHALAGGGTPGYSYVWTPAQTGNVIQNLLAGTYTLNLKDAKNCTLAITAIVPQPAPLSSSVIGITNAMCHSGTGSASVSATGGETPYSFTWNSNPVQTGNTLSTVLSGNYTVNIKDINNCVSQKTVSITEPSQVITSVTKNDTVCFGKTGVLNASANGGKGNYHYTWLPGAITNSGSLTFSASTTISYTVLAFDEDGCSGKDATAIVTVYNLTPPQVHVEGLDLICPGRSSIIEADVHGNNGPLTYTWNNNLPPKAGAHIVTPGKNTTYIVTVSNSCGMSVTDSLEVRINDLPLVNLSSDTLNACVPGIINFTDKSQPINASDPLISWTWDFGDGTFSGEQNPSHTFTEAGTYTVNLEVTTDRGCSNKNTSVPVIIQAYPQPFAAFTMNSDSLDLPYDVLKCSNQSTGAVSYNWSFGTDGASTLPEPEFLMQTLGDNKIQLIAFSQYGCSDTTSKIVNTTADVVFPNAFTPNEEGASGGAYSISSLNNDVLFPYTSGVVEYKLQVFNRWGELIFESTDVKQGWDGYYRGKLCQVGVYVWKAHVLLNNGKLFNKAGNISLLR